MNRNVYDWAASISFGGVVAGGAAAIIYLRYPHLFPSNVNIHTVTLFGIGLGTTCQRVFTSWIRSILYPISKDDDFYEKLEELHQLWRTNQITEAQYRDIVAKLTEKRFLGSASSQSADKSLPPPRNNT